MKSCPRCRAELVDHWHGGRCAERACPSFNERLLLCIRDFTACGWTGCPGLLPQYALARAQLLGVLQVHAAELAELDDLALEFDELDRQLAACAPIAERLRPGHATAVTSTGEEPATIWARLGGPPLSPADHAAAIAKYDPAKLIEVRPSARKRRLTWRNLGGLLLAHGRHAGLSIDLVYVRRRLRRWAAFDTLAKRASLRRAMTVCAASDESEGPA